MRTTIELPDALFRRVKARAALDGVTLKDLVARLVDQGMRRSTSPAPGDRERRRSELPVVRAATGRALPDLGHGELQAILEAEEVAGGRTG